MFTIDYATAKDIPQMMKIIEESLPLIPDPDWFVGDTPEFYAKHIRECGFTLKATYDPAGVLAAFFTVRYPKLDSDNCGYDLDFTDTKLLKTVHMETCVVHPKYRGHHLESRLMKNAIILLNETDYRHLLGTVHPDNIPSLKAFLTNDFHIEKTLKKYGGKLRHIMYREIQFLHSLDVLKLIKGHLETTPDVKMQKMLNQIRFPVYKKECQNYNNYK